MQDVQETEAEKVKTGAAETGEGSGENKKCMIMYLPRWGIFHKQDCQTNTVHLKVVE